MKFDKETTVFLLIITILMIAWPTISSSLGWSSEEEEEVAAETTVTATAAAPAAAAAPANNTTPATPAAPEKAVSPAAEILENSFLKMTVSPELGAITQIIFCKYKNSELSGDITIGNTELFSVNIPDSRVISAAFTRQDEKSLKLDRTLALPQGNIRVEQTFSFAGDYIVQSNTVITNLTDKAVFISGASISGGTIAPWHTVSGDKIRSMSHRLDLLTADGDYEDIDADEDDDDYFFHTAPEVQWAAVSNKYFCSILKNSSGKNYNLWQKERSWITDVRDNEVPVVTIGAELPKITLQPGGGAESFEFTAYTGPKNSDALAAFAPDGSKVMHLAWGPLNYLARFLMWILNLLYAVFNSYGVSIIILTLLVRSAFYPITSKGNESMRKMQKVQPIFKELREKYKDDPQLLNQKMSEVYRKEGINPFAGCLPILLQIPIFFALYAMLDNAIALRHVSFLWAKNLAAADTIFRIPLGFTLPFFNVDAIPVNPLVLMMTALMVVQQRMTPMAADPAQKRMMAFMPVIMLFFLYDLPSGLTLYWTVSNLFSILQLWLQKRKRSQEPAASNAGSK